MKKVQEHLFLLTCSQSKDHTKLPMQWAGVYPVKSPISTLL